MGGWLPYKMALERRLEAIWAKRTRSHRMSIEGGIVRAICAGFAGSFRRSTTSRQHR